MTSADVSGLTSSNGASPTLFLDRFSVEGALRTANQAPSIHNTQPWSWELRLENLALRADRSRQLPIADPDGHSLMISCGAALALAQLSLQAQGWKTTVHRHPDPADPDLLAFLQPIEHLEPTAADQQLVLAAQNRISERRPFAAKPVSAADMQLLQQATDAPGVHVYFPEQEDQRISLAAAIGWADRIEANDSAYIDEAKRWLGDPYGRGDGIALAAVPHLEPGQSRHSDVALRDFELGVTGKELIARDVDEHPLIAVILSDEDSAAEQLAAGEAMMRLMLAAENLGLASCPLSQAVDLAHFRTKVKSLMGWQGVPQMMLRLGHAPTNSAKPGRTPRRPLQDTLKVFLPA